jgi:hypothetical protein
MSSLRFKAHNTPPLEQYGSINQEFDFGHELLQLDS